MTRNFNTNKPGWLKRRQDGTSPMLEALMPNGLELAKAKFMRTFKPGVNQCAFCEGAAYHVHVCIFRGHEARLIGDPTGGPAFVFYGMCRACHTTPDHEARMRAKSLADTLIRIE